MVFTSTNNKKVPNLNVKINSASIEKVNSFNFLGIHIDDKLTWKAHINNLSTKISKSTGVLNQLNNYVPQNILTTIYSSLTLSHLNYGISCWGYARKTILKPITTLQKKAIRIITKGCYNCHTSPLFKQLNMLKVEDMIKLNEYKVYFKHTQHELPEYHMVNIEKAPNKSNTRHKQLLKIPFTKTKAAERDIFSNCPITINNSPTIITEKVHTHTYKSYVRYIKSRIITDYEINCERVNCQDNHCQLIRN